MMRFFLQPTTDHQRYTRNLLDGCSERTFFQSYFEFSKLHKSHMYNIYSSVCFETGERFKDMSKAKTKAFIRRKLESKEDWWLTAEEAVTHGFVDGVVGAKKYPSISGIRKKLV